MVMGKRWREWGEAKTHKTQWSFLGIAGLVIVLVDSPERAQRASMEGGDRWENALQRECWQSSIHQGWPSMKAPGVWTSCSCFYEGRMLQR